MAEIPVLAAYPFDGRYSLRDHSCFDTVYVHLSRPTSHGGRVRVTGAVNRADGLAEIQVSDTGVGMSEEVLARLFDITQNKSQLGTDMEKGSGLGLILCRELLAMQGQDLHISSREGEGTVVRITLPLWQEDE